MPGPRDPEIMEPLLAPILGNRSKLCPDHSQRKIHPLGPLPPLVRPTALGSRDGPPVLAPPDSGDSYQSHPGPLRSGPIDSLRPSGE